MERAHPSPLIVVPASLAACLFLLVCAATPSTSAAAPGAATPEAAWQMAKDAYLRGDFRAYIESVSPTAHDECICQVTFLVGMALDGGVLKSDQELKEMNEILRRYGIGEIRPATPDPGAQERPGLTGRKAIHLIQDKVGLYAEMMTYLGKHRIGARLPADMAVDIGDVKVDGATATGRRGRFGAITFDKIGDSWFVHPAPVCLNDIFRDEKLP